MIMPRYTTELSPETYESIAGKLRTRQPLSNEQQTIVNEAILMFPVACPRARVLAQLVEVYA